MRILLSIIVVAIILLFSACGSRMSTTAFHGYDTEFVSTGLDGSMILRVWASGLNRQDAIEQAKKKAVYDVTFSGIPSNATGHNSFPVIDEANARQKYEDYFNRFFADGGEYEKYVSTDNHSKKAMKKYKGDGNQTYEIMVTVNRSELKKRYVDDNIIIK